MLYRIASEAQGETPIGHRLRRSRHLVIPVSTLCPARRLLWFLLQLSPVGIPLLEMMKITVHLMAVCELLSTAVASPTETAKWKGRRRRRQDSRLHAQGVESQELDRPLLENKTWAANSA